MKKDSISNKQETNPKSFRQQAINVYNKMMKNRKDKKFELVKVNDNTWKEVEIK